eukprot:12006003-Ditylum_brightwellii.AAC.1
MKTEGKAGWIEAVTKELNSFKKYKVLTPTWAMKPKPNGIKQARLTACGLEQVDSSHFDSQDLLVLVVNGMTIRMMFVLTIMASWLAELLDINGSFLNSCFQNNEKLYMKKAFRLMGYSRKKADPCLMFQWINELLFIWISWVNDCLIAGPQDYVKQEKQKMMDMFKCDELGTMDEYVGCKVEQDLKGQSMKITQPVLLQSYADEFEMDKHGKNSQDAGRVRKHLEKG